MKQLARVECGISFPAMHTPDGRNGSALDRLVYIPNEVLDEFKSVRIRVAETPLLLLAFVFRHKKVRVLTVIPMRYSQS